MELFNDPMLATISPGSVPEDWATRAIFSHPLASDLWTLRANEPEAFEACSNVVAMYSAAILEMDECWEYLVSLGCGDGTVDAAIITALRLPSLHYIPVDISRSMCAAAGAVVQQTCLVPFGVVGDFEGGFEFIRGALAPIHTMKKLICCVGNALGNLDLGERGFIENVLDLMVAGDHCVLSVATGMFSEPINRATFDSNVGWSDLKEMLSCGVSMITGEAAEGVSFNLDARLDARKGATDVPGAGAIALWDQLSKRKLLNLRRYDFAATRSWIGDCFPVEIVRSRQVDIESSNVGIGMLILRKR